MIPAGTDLAERLEAALTPVFGQSPTFICDLPAMVEWLTSLGCRATAFTEAEHISHKHRKNVVAIATNEAAIPPYSHWYTLFRNSRVLIIPMVSFDPSLDAAIYTMQMMANSDFAAAIQLNRQWLSTLLRDHNQLTFRGQGCEFECDVEDDVYVMKPRTEVLLSPGEWESIGSYFEVGMVPQPEDIRPAFVVNGTLLAPGVAVAHHRQMPDGLLPLAARAWDLFQQLRAQGSFPLRIEIVDSRVVRALAGDTDISDELAELSNKRRDLVLTEMAFSTNGCLNADLIDWTRNAQLNEGAVGIHAAIGDGLTGAHIDFLCPGVELAM